MKKLSLLFTFLIAILLSFGSEMNAQVISAPLGTSTSSSSTRGPIQRSDSGSSSVHSRANLVYTATELASIGIVNGTVISQINWDLGSTNVITAAGDATLDIYMKNSSVTGATADSWANLISGSTPVATHTFNLANNFPGAEGFMDFPLSTGFLYTGGTLEVQVEWDCSNLIPADPTEPNLLFSGNGAIKWHWTATAHTSLIYNAGSSPPSNISSNLKAERVNTQFVTIPGAGTAQTGCVGSSTSSSSTRGPIQRSDSGSSSVHSRANLVYTATELAAMGINTGATLTQISWDLGSTNVITAAGDATLDIYMKNSSVTGASADSWSNLISGSTPVATHTFNLTNNFPGVEGIMDFPLSTDFLYTGGTLEVQVEWDCSNLIPADPTEPNLLFSGNGAIKWHWTATAHTSLVYNAGSSPPSNISSNLKAERVNTCFGFTTPAGDPPTLPITFDDADVNYNLVSFGDNANGTVSAEIATDPADPDNSVLSVTKDPGAECWGGVVVGDEGLAEAIPFAGDRLIMTVDVYSPEVGSVILLKVEDASDSEIASEVAVATTVANAWETLTFDFATGSPFINLNNTYDKVVLFPQFCGSPTLSSDPFFFDNVVILPADGPVFTNPTIPVSFDTPNTFYNIENFGGGSGSLGIDPADPNNTVLALTKPPGSECWGGVATELSVPIPFTAGETEMRMDVYSPVAGATFLLKVENSADGAIASQVSATVSAANTWETLVFDFANGDPALDLNNVYDKIAIFPQFCGALPLTTGTHFVDNVRMTTQPFLECRQPTSTVNTEGLCGAADLIVLDPFVLDPDEVGVYSLANNAPDFYPIGTTTNTYTLTTAAGDSTCDQLVIIADNEGPTVSSCNTLIEFIEPGSCTATFSIEVVTTDNCGVASITGINSQTVEFGLYEQDIVITDVNGNVTVHPYTVQVHDDLGPEFTNCPEETITLTSPSFPTSLMPSAVDACGLEGVTNDIPADGLPAGASTVTFTAEDTYGNSTDCVVDVMVMGDEISLHPASDIGATLAENENSQIVTWNPLNATTQCSYCDETNLEGFTFIGNYWGHQYFLADELSLTREDAQLIAEGYDAHLAVISTDGENNYLKEALSNEVRTAWIGLMPQNINGSWSFVWDNDEANVFNALDLDMNEVNANTRIVLSQDGDWIDATDTEEKYFLIERPCVNFTQVGPYAPSTELGSAQLLRSGDAWPEGEYEVVYSAVDMCGNESQLSFDVTVQPEVSEFCTTAGTDNSVWIEGVTFHEMTNTSASNEGYADFAETVTTMNIGDGLVLLDLTAGGNTTEEVLYWRVWLDKNNDGDFFDAGEVLFEQSTENTHLQANVELGQETVSNARLRIAVARHAFPAPCGNPYVGEVEDYTVTLTVPDVIDVEREAEIRLFPNPADTYVNVDLSDFAGEGVSIRVINNLGKSVFFSKEIVAIKGNVRLDLQGITGGMYNISVSTSTRQITKRFVISNVKRMATAR